MKTRKKLIEVALPLEAINTASAREKSIRHGHPSTLHLWWARRPLASARAVIFAQMVDDPASCPEEFPDVATQQAERKRLFDIIEQLVLWENTTNEAVLNQARAELWRSWRRTCADNADHPRASELFDPERLPAFHDPFAGGGALPLEAQRLGLESHASDLNPVAVMINKAMIEIPPKFAGQPPVNPEWRTKSANEQALKPWLGAQGLAEDVRYYGQWMRDEAEKRIGHLYPKVTVTAEMARERPDLAPYVGKSLTVIAWIWARTVKSPNPAFAHVDVPLASTFMLSTKAGKEAYVEPVIDGDSYRFTVKMGKSKEAEKGTKSSGSRSNFLCMMSAAPMTFEYLRNEAKADRMGARLMAIVAEGNRERIYLTPTNEHEVVANTSKPSWKPEVEISHWPGRTNVVEYGLTNFGDLFTDRQLVALTTFSDLVGEAIERVYQDALASGQFTENQAFLMTNAPHRTAPHRTAPHRTAPHRTAPHDDTALNSPSSTPSTDSSSLTTPLAQGGTGARAYAQAMGVYLGFGVDKLSDRSSNICSWDSSRDSIRNVFGKQAIPMIWDFAESNTISETGGSYLNAIDQISKFLHISGSYLATASQQDAQNQKLSLNKIVSTDPPYYDNIGYADLSDFFYVWMRRTLRTIYPEIFSTLAVPKADELVATPYRHGSKNAAEHFFLDGMTQAMAQIATQSHPAFPVTIYYAFKQSDSGADGTTNTGWDTFLEAVIRAGFAINGTWPQRTEMANRMIGSGTNALASSIVLVCRRRDLQALTATRTDFVRQLRSELPGALRDLQASNIAPVDLAQAAIGPGMGIYTRYAQVIDNQGEVVSVRAALMLINQVLDEVLAEQEGDFDADSRWAITWFEQHGFAAGDFGEADVLARAKMTGVDGLARAGIVESSRGKVRLFAPSELPADWDPRTDGRLTAWESVHHLIRAINTGGEQAAATLIGQLGSMAEVARELSYRLYTICERKKRAQEAIDYNALVQNFGEMRRIAQQQQATQSQRNEQQASLF